MCLTHQEEADVVIRRRLARAEASNLAGWRMIVDASARLSLPHLPGGLATRLAADPGTRPGRPGSRGGHAERGASRNRPGSARLVRR